MQTFQEALNNILKENNKTNKIQSNTTTEKKYKDIYEALSAMETEKGIKREAAIPLKCKCSYALCLPDRDVPVKVSTQ